MTDAPGAAGAGRTDSCWKFLQIFKSFRLARRIPNVVVALAALLGTFALGGVLDVFWKWADRSVPADAVSHYVYSRSLPADFSRDPLGAVEAALRTGLDQPGEAAGKPIGVFAAWYRFEGQALESVMESVWHANFGGITFGLKSAALGCLWLLAEHTFFAVLFFLGGIAIWAFAGGFICRIAAVQFAREESIGFSESISFVKDRYAGLLLAPLIPVVATLLIGLVLVFGGVILSIPYFGDVVGSLLFGVALVVGVGIALLALGTAFGGHLFWPTIAVEGSDGLDAVSRSVNYVAAKPWRTIGYGLIAIVYISLCFLLAKLFVFLILWGVHVFVGFGTSPFGWWGDRGAIGTKLDALWLMPRFDNLSPTPGGSSGVEAFASGVIATWVMLVIALLWSLLISLYFSASTVVYFLLRQDNDAMDLEDIYIEEYREGVREPAAAPSAAAAAPPPTAAHLPGVQVTIGGQPSATDAAGGEPANEPQDVDGADKE
jgi:hypothetical protein